MFIYWFKIGNDEYVFKNIMYWRNPNFSCLLKLKIISLQKFMFVHVYLLYIRTMATPYTNVLVNFKSALQLAKTWVRKRNDVVIIRLFYLPSLTFYFQKKLLSFIIKMQLSGLKLDKHSLSGAPVFFQYFWKKAQLCSNKFKICWKRTAENCFWIKTFYLSCCYDMVRKK